MKLFFKVLLSIELFFASLFGFLWILDAIIGHAHELTWQMLDLGMLLLFFTVCFAFFIDPLIDWCIDRF
jgi:hypothetical protein